MAGTASRFLAKVFTRTGGTLKEVLDAGVLLNVPKIVREVGKPAGEVSIELARPYDDFGFEDTIDLGYLVKIYAVNEANPTGILVYQGHIEEIRGHFDATRNSVTLRLFPIDALIGRAFWKDGASYTKTYTTADVDTIFSDAITDLNTVHGATFFTGNLASPALSLNFSFVQQTHLQALNTAFGSLPSTWYWRVRANGQIDLQEYADTTETHKLVVGKHIDAVDVTRSIMDVKNGLRLAWGGTPTYAFYNDATSETDYGKRQYAQAKSDITNSTTADAYGDGEVDRQKDPKVKTKIMVNSSYAIETILPGDTVQVFNLQDTTSQMLTGILRVIRTEYDGSLATLHLADIIENFGNEFGKAI